MKVQTQPGLEVRPNATELTTTLMERRTQRYDLDAATSVVKGLLSYSTEIRGDGLHVKKEYMEDDPSQEVFHWTPACDMDWPGAPDPMKAPSLPMEFSANELAAYMLGGVGELVAIYYGGWEHGPDEGMLEAMGIQAREPRTALRAAYAAYRDAEKVVGKRDEVLQQQAQELQGSLDQANGEANDLNRVFENGTSEAARSARRAVARASVSAMAAKADEVTTQAKNALVAWRKAMVYQLLGPVAAIPQWAAFQKHQRLWRAVRFDQSRVTAEIEKRRSLRPTNLADTAMQDEMLAALGAELSQIHNRLSALGTGMDVETRHSLEASCAIEEMAESRRQPLSVDEAFARKCEIELANKEIDALIAAQKTLAPEQGTGTRAPVVPVPKQRAQEVRILELLTAKGYDPLKLSRRAQGKPGPKAEIRTLALTERAMFSKSSFDKAWERLRNDGAVAGAE